ncbi:MAG: hypothetical protein KDA84_07305 [Planctomycetaceae bacterium]|nr:hypothetical protein [Planctomycetaceae bacterium]
MPGSITELIHTIRQGGNSETETKLYCLFSKRVEREARRLLGDTSPSATNWEDVALSTMNSVLLRLRSVGPNLENREALVSLCFKRLYPRINKERNKRRNKGNQVLRQGDVQSADSEPTGAREPRDNHQLVKERTKELLELLTTPGKKPAPEDRAIILDYAKYIEDLPSLLNDLMDLLPKADWRKVAKMKLANYSNEKIAEAIDCSERTVERHLANIRDYWGAPTEREAK